MNSDEIDTGILIDWLMARGRQKENIGKSGAANELFNAAHLIFDQQEALRQLQARVIEQADLIGDMQAELGAQQADNQRLVAENRDMRTALESVQAAIQEAEQDDTLSLADTIDDEVSARIDAALQQEQEGNDG